MNKVNQKIPLIELYQPINVDMCSTPFITGRTKDIRFLEGEKIGFDILTGTNAYPVRGRRRNKNDHL